MNSLELRGLNVLEQNNNKHVIFKVESKFFNAEPKNEFIYHQNLSFLVFKRFVLKKTKKVMCLAIIDIWRLVIILLKLRDKFAYLHIYFCLVYILRFFAF